jgi:hypothetical protein
MTPEQSPIKKVIVIGVSIALVIAALYFFLFRSSEPQMIIDEFGNPVEAQVVGQDLIDLLAELEGVTLDQSLFSREAFVNLTDFAQNLPNEPRGRANPFSSL